MSIPKPTVADIGALATRLGYDCPPADAQEYTAIITELLAGYHAVDSMTAADAPVSTSGRAWRVPAAGEDPFNAWAITTAIPGATTGPLAGRSVAVKDSIMIAGVPMANGSSLLDGFVPDFDATVVTRVLAAGARIVGKTSCEYLCLSGGSHTGAAGPVHNPHRPGYSAGGSSSGNAVAIATGQAELALGTDQAGSIRVPASYCGLVGLKPTLGLVPYTGVAPLDPMLDHVGPMSATVADTALLLSVLAGVDGYDTRQRSPCTGDYLGALSDGLSGMHIGVLGEAFGPIGADLRVADAVREAAAVMGKLGARVSEVSVPMHPAGLALWMPVIMHGAAHTVVHGQGFGIGRDDRYPVAMMRQLFAARNRADELPANVKACALLAEYVSEHAGQSYYGRAVNGIRQLRAAYDEVLSGVDLVLMPTTPTAAQPLPGPGASITEWCAKATDMFANTAPFNVTHHPALSLPCPGGDGLPIGLMLVGRHFDEATVLRAAHTYEQRDA